MRKGERRTGVGSGAVDGSLAEERNESVEGKDRVHVSEWNAISNCSYAICLAATGHRIQVYGNTLQSDDDTSTDIIKMTQYGWNNWRQISGILCDEGTTTC